MPGNWQGEREEARLYIWTTCGLNFKCAESTLKAGEGAGLSRQLEMVEPHVCIQTWRSKTLTLCNVRQGNSADAQRSEMFLGQCLLTRLHDNCYYKGKNVDSLGFMTYHKSLSCCSLSGQSWIIIVISFVYTHGSVCAFVNLRCHSSRAVHLFVFMFCFLETAGLSHVPVTHQLG